MIVGKTNMTEFAFSGIGMNPHYGTPAIRPTAAACLAARLRVRAVALADGMCEISIGSDTGGSVRVPSAFCGVMGFKPTQIAYPAPVRWRFR